MAWAQGSETAAGLHGALTTLVLVLVALHVAGALYGQFVQKTGVLDRMRRPG